MIFITLFSVLCFAFIEPATATYGVCPKTTCGSLANNQCANLSINATNTSSETFVGQLCSNASTYCPVSLSLFNSTTNASSTCTAPNPVASRYPGEQCDSAHTCLNNQNCTNGVCTGVAAGGVCKSNIDCLVGYWCQLNATGNNTCVAQVAAGAPCSTDYMCPNTQGCLAGNCTDYYSQKLLTNTASKSVESPAGSFCISMKEDASALCYGLAYANSTSMTPNKDGLVPCNTTTSGVCSYLDSNNKTVNLDCLCSYDPNGASYCPKAYNEADSNWQTLSSSRRQQMGAPQCHTLNRFNCANPPKAAYNSHYAAQFVTSKAAHFFYAQDCIRRLFNAGEFLKFSFAILFGLFVSLF